MCFCPLCFSLLTYVLLLLFFLFTVLFSSRLYLSSVLSPDFASSYPQPPSHSSILIFLTSLSHSHPLLSFPPQTRHSHSLYLSSFIFLRAPSFISSSSFSWPPLHLLTHLLPVSVAGNRRTPHYRLSCLNIHLNKVEFPSFVCVESMHNLAPTSRPPTCVLANPCIIVMSFMHMYTFFNVFPKVTHRYTHRLLVRGSSGILLCSFSDLEAVQFIDTFLTRGLDRGGCLGVSRWAERRERCVAPPVHLGNGGTVVNT